MFVPEPRQLPNLLTILPLPLPLPKPSSSTSPTTSATSLSSVASEVSTTSSASTSSTVSSSISESSYVAPSPTSSDLPIPTTTPASTDYITLYTTPSPSPSVQAAPSGSKGFLQNKALSGTVLGVVGVVGLAILIAIATIAIRRSRRHRLHTEAISFDPKGGDGTEKRRFSLLSSDDGHNVNSNVVDGNVGRGYPGMNPASAPFVGTRQDPYRFPASESQHTLIGNAQPPWSRNAGTPHVPRIDLAWVNGNRHSPVQPSDIPFQPDRTTVTEPPYNRT